MSSWHLNRLVKREFFWERNKQEKCRKMQLCMGILNIIIIKDKKSHKMCKYKHRAFLGSTGSLNLYLGKSVLYTGVTDSCKNGVASQVWPALWSTRNRVHTPSTHNKATAAECVCNPSAGQCVQTCKSLAPWPVCWAKLMSSRFSKRPRLKRQSQGQHQPVVFTFVHPTSTHTDTQDVLLYIVITDYNHNWYVHGSNQYWQRT